MYKIVKTSFTTNHVSITNNKVQPGNFELRPLLSRKVGKIKENLYFTILHLAIKSTKEKPFPVNIIVELVGTFEFKDIENEIEIDSFLKFEAVRIMFPYLRTIVTNLSVAAMMPPIVLPIIDTSMLFKDNVDSTFIN